MLLASMRAMLILAMLGLWLPSLEGVGAYYHEVDIRDVCLRRNENGWHSSPLSCDWYCLVAAVEPEYLGEWWFVKLPSCGYHVCQVVDVGAEQDLSALRAHDEVIEISGDMAQVCGWTDYTPGVEIWRLAKEKVKNEVLQ